MTRRARILWRIAEYGACLLGLVLVITGIAIIGFGELGYLPRRSKLWGELLALALSLVGLALCVLAGLIRYRL